MFKIDAVLGTTTLSLKEVQDLEKGSIISVGIPAGDKIKCFHKDEFLFYGEVMVFEKNLAIRINQEHIDENFEMIYEDEEEIQEEEFFTNFDYLKEIKTNLIADFTQTEHPQTIALILSYIEPERAAEILESYDNDLKIEVLLRISKLGEISPVIISQVSRVLKKKLEALSLSEIEVGGIKAVNEIMAFIKEKEEIIKGISEIDLSLAEEIKPL